MRVASDSEDPIPADAVWISVSVQDSGRGLAPEEQTGLFKRTHHSLVGGNY